MVSYPPWWTGWSADPTPPASKPRFPLHRTALRTAVITAIRILIYGNVREDWWATWFGPTYLAVYDRVLAQRTPAEVDGVEHLLRLQQGSSVLDLACGQGRHAIELARRGYQVTGLDLSGYLLGLAAERGRAAGVSVRWIQADMRHPPLDGFDAAINLFTAFGYFANDSDNQAVLTATAACLRPGGRFLLELINADHLQRTFTPREWFTVGDVTVVEERQLEAGGSRLHVHRSVSGPQFEEVTEFQLRLYVRRELEAMLVEAGFGSVDAFGDWAGEPFSAESPRLLIVAGRG